MVFPFPKAVIKKIEAICRAFLWIGKDNPSHKSPVAWKTICRSRTQGGLGLIDLTLWNQANLLKLLWNICNKTDILWIRRVHVCYLRNIDVLNAGVKTNNTWIMKNILQQRDCVAELQPLWSQMSRFQLGVIYKKLLNDEQTVSWISMTHHNRSRPQAVFTLWQACHRKLATKDQLRRFGMIT